MSKCKNKKKIARILLLCYLIFFGSIAVIFALIRTPFVQNFIAHKAASYLSEELGTKVEIGKIDINFMCDLTLYDLEIWDKHDNVILKTDALRADFEGYSKNEIIFNTISLKNTTAQIIKYKDEDALNFDFIIKYFSGEKKSESKSSSPALKFNSINIENCNFTYHIENSKEYNSPINFNKLIITGLNLHANDINFANGKGGANLQHLSFTDRSGFTVKHLSGKIGITDTKIDSKNMKIATNNSFLDLDLAFNFNNFKCFNHFIDSVDISADFNKSIIDIDDIAYFSNSIQGMSNTATLEGNVNGPVSDIKGENMKVKFGNNTKLNFDLSMKGLPYFDETQIDLNLKQSNIQISEISKFKLPKGETINLGETLNSIGNATVEGRFYGYVSDFTAQADVKTKNSSLKADVKLKGTGTNSKYSGNLKFNNFDVGLLAGKSSKLEQSTGSINFSGSGTTQKSLAISGDGNIDLLTFNGYNYENIEFNLNYEKNECTGEVNINDENAVVYLNGYANFSQEQPSFDFTVDVDRLFLNPLNFNRNDSLAFASVQINAKLSGIDIDSLKGNAKISNINYSEGNKKIICENFDINIDKIDSNSRNIKINSDIIDGELKGNFDFKDIKNAFDLYTDLIINNGSTDLAASTAFEYNLTIKNTDDIFNIFVPNLRISQNTIVKGSIDSKTKFLRAEIAANNLNFGSTKIENLSILGETFGNTIYFTVQSEQINLTDSNSIDNIIINTVTLGENTDFTAHWDNHKKIDKKEYSGDINGRIKLKKENPIDITFAESQLILNDSAYHISNKSRIIIDTSSIWIKAFELASDYQGIAIEGRISKDPMDVVQVTFNNVQTATFNDFLKSAQIETTGNINGYILLSNLYSSLDFRSDLKIGKLTINKNNVGDASLICSWDRARQSIYTDFWIEYQGNVGKNIPLKLDGYYNPRDSISPLDFDLKLDRFNLKLVEPYLSSFASGVSGLCDGSVNLKGNFNNPQINGDINFRRTNIKIDYLNTSYSFAHNVHLDNKSISMKNVRLFDNGGNECNGNIEIKHDNFKDFYLDIMLNANKMQFLNTTAKDNNDFYGKAYASGLVKLYGPFDMINIEVMAKTNAGTVIALPISSSGELSQNNFIDFVNNQNTDTTIIIEKKTSSGGVSLDLDLEVTPDAEIQIAFDPKVGDIMKGSGSGNMKMTIDRNGELLMYGNIEIEKGEYLFTLENILNKKFIIDKGGTIKWSGDPYKGQMDLTAKYNLKTSLYELVSAVDPSEQYKSKVPVSCLMYLKGDLLSPNITFGLDLPNSDENTKNIVNSLIPTTEEMNKQVFSLLILNSFFQTSADSYSNPLSQGIGTTSTELLVNQFSNWMSQLSKDFDIGFNYSQGNEISTTQVEVMLSTQLFDNRIEIDGNLGVGGNQVTSTGTQTQQTSNIVGDVSVEYKIDKEGKFRLKAFNRSNTTDLVTNEAPYTQGVAFFYRKNFDKIRELWLNDKKRKNETNKK